MLGGARNESSSAHFREVVFFTTQEADFVMIYSLMGSTAKADSDGMLKGPVPAELQAATLNSYSVPSNKRVT